MNRSSIFCGTKDESAIVIGHPFLGANWLSLAGFVGLSTGSTADIFNQLRQFPDVRSYIESEGVSENSSLDECDRFLRKLYTAENPDVYKRVNGAIIKDSAEDLQAWKYFILNLSDVITMGERHSGTVFRGLKCHEEMSVGQTFFLRNFTSTSTEETVARGFLNNDGMLLRINLNSSVNSIRMDDVSEYPHEKEVLLHPGSMFTVTDVDIEEGSTVITLEAMKTFAISTAFTVIWVDANIATAENEALYDTLWDGGGACGAHGIERFSSVEPAVEFLLDKHNGEMSFLVVTSGRLTEEFYNSCSKMTGDGTMLFPPVVGLIYCMDTQRYEYLVETIPVVVGVTNIPTHVHMFVLKCFPRDFWKKTEEEVKHIMSLPTYRDYMASENK